MKDWLSCEIGHKYEKTLSFYKKKGDATPLFETNVSGDYRITLRQLLVGCAVAAVATVCLVLGAEFDRRDVKK